MNTANLTPLTLAMIVADSGNADALDALVLNVGRAEADALVAFIRSPASAPLFRSFFSGGAA